MSSQLLENQQLALRSLPALSALLEMPEIQPLIQRYSEESVKFFARSFLDETRAEILKNKNAQLIDVKGLLKKLETALMRHLTPEGRRAINATGILLHTGLGRAPFADDVEAQLRLFQNYTILQTDVVTGERSERETEIEKLLIELTGCEAATVVNNNAAATMLILHTLAFQKEAIISRGQLVEIGGAFRIPDVMTQSQAILKEVGTTNRTHLKDYQNAIGENTGAILHVHTSNYRIRGFSSMPNIKELCELRDKIAPELPVVDDLGSGSLIPLSEFGITDEPLIKNSILAGADLCSFSGDKLICGPQAGIICGKKKWVDKIKKSPYMRMFRVCKMTLAVLETTLHHFVRKSWMTQLPLYQMLTFQNDVLKSRADTLQNSVQATLEKYGYFCKITDSISYIGSGSIPDEGIPSIVLEVHPGVNARWAVQCLAGKLRAACPSVFARIADNTLVFDMRTLLHDDPVQLAHVINQQLEL